jgi:hypothetical protein
MKHFQQLAQKSKRTRVVQHELIYLLPCTTLRLILYHLNLILLLMLCQPISRTQPPACSAKLESSGYQRLD